MDVPGDLDPAIDKSNRDDAVECDCVVFDNVIDEIVDNGHDNSLHKDELNSRYRRPLCRSFGSRPAAARGTYEIRESPACKSSPLIIRNAIRSASAAIVLD